MASNIITLNVGGTLYTTSIQTLTSRPDSMLGKMFATQSQLDPSAEDEHGRLFMLGNMSATQSQLDPSAKDEHGRFFIDRDGPMFRHVLNFLRNTSLTLPKDFKDLDLLMQEAEFYQIEPLIKALKGVVDAAGDNETKGADCIIVEYIDAEHWKLIGKQAVLEDILQQMGYSMEVRSGYGVRILKSIIGEFEGYEYSRDFVGLPGLQLSMRTLLIFLIEIGFSVNVGCSEDNFKGTWVFRR